MGQISMGVALVVQVLNSLDDLFKSELEIFFDLFFYAEDAIKELSSLETLKNKIN